MNIVDTYQTTCSRTKYGAWSPERWLQAKGKVYIGDVERDKCHGGEMAFARRAVEVGLDARLEDSKPPRCRMLRQIN
jgi:hypothetical protein